MARLGVDYQQVSRAARSLVDDGQTPTVDNVRLRLGGTGSKSTIGPLLKRWKTENVNTVNQVTSGVPADILESVQRLYESVQHRFQEELAATEMAATSRVAEFEGMNEELRGQLAQCEDRTRQLDDELQRKDSYLTTALAELEAVRQARRESELACAALEQRMTERSSEVVHLREQIDQAHQQLEHFMAAVNTRWEEEQKANDARMAVEIQTSQGLREQLQVVHSEAVTKGHQLSEINLRHEKLALEHEKMHTTVDELRQQNARKDEQAVALKRELERSTKTLADVQQKYDLCLVRAINAETSLAVSQSNQVMLGTRLSDAEERAVALQGDKLALLRHSVELEASLRQYEQELKKLRKS
jgi:DNA repair exonuclease SbcCD ATPase subunit